MDESGDWLKWMGPTGAAIAAAALFLRQYLSRALVDRAADDAIVATLKRLQEEIVMEHERAKKERERADKLMVDREQMIAELGQLRGEVAALRSQVEVLTQLIRERGSEGEE